MFVRDFYSGWFLLCLIIFWLSTFKVKPICKLLFLHLSGDAAKAQCRSTYDSVQKWIALHC